MPLVLDNSGSSSFLGNWIYYTGYSASHLTPTTFDPSLGSIYSYVKSKGVFVCPDDSSNQGNSYAINSLTNGITLNQFTAPAATILIVEEEDGFRGGTDDGDDANCSNATPGLTDLITKRHNGGAVYAMCDGHAKYYFTGKLDNTTAPGTAADGDPHYQL
jgi:prepilin-type processing-associated H-X9-DG protein